MFKKSIAIVIVAMFCISAFAIMNNSDDASADGTSTLTYSYYVEFNDGTNSYSARLPDASVTGTAASGALHEEAFTAACTSGGLTATFGSYNMISSVVANEVTYAGSGTWKEDGYYDFAIYYYKDGAWASSSLSDSTALVVVFGQYLFSEPSDSSKYLKQGDSTYGYYWTPLPTVSVVEYKIYFQLKDSDGSSYSTWVTSNQFGISAESLKSARALGGQAVGITVNNNAKYATSLVSVVANGHTYASSGTYGQDDYIGFAGYTAADGNTWAVTSSADLTTATVFAHTLDYYKMTDPQDSTYFYHEAAYGMDAYWTKLPAVLPDGSSANPSDNSLLIYGAIAGVVIIIVVMMAAFMIRKKQA